MADKRRKGRSHKVETVTRVAAERSEGAKIAKVEVEPVPVRIKHTFGYNEETESIARNPEKDAELFSSASRQLAAVMSDIHTLKTSGLSNNAAVEERKAQACVLFTTLKKLNRIAHTRCKNARDNTHEAKLRGDIKYLALQNLLYEQLHLQREISRCLEFRSRHDDITLVNEEEFFTNAPVSISRPEVTRQDSHQCMLARLDWELEQRKKLTAEYSESVGEQERVTKEIEEKREQLQSLQPQLSAILQAMEPLQKTLATPDLSPLEPTPAACSLPSPLYCLYVQASAYACACDKRLIVRVAGNVEEARNLDKQRDTSPEEESESEQEEDAPQPRRRTTQDQQVSTRHHLLMLHPLCVELEINCQDGSQVTLTFHFLVNLGVLTVRVQTCCTPKHSSLSGSDLMIPSALLCSLYPGDSGDESPNPANRYQFNKLGLTSLADYIDDVGRPYLWAQWLGGIKFPPKCQAVTDQDLSSSSMRSTVHRIRRRLSARIALQKQFSAFERGSFAVPVSTPPLVPSKLLSHLSHWVSVSHAEYEALSYTRHHWELCPSPPTSLYYHGCLDRGPAQMHIAVWLDCNYPKPPPILSLHLMWEGQHTAQDDINILAMEKEVNVFWADFGCQGSEILSLQLAHLAACLDVYLETSDIRPSHKGCTAFPRDKMLLRVTRGPSRVKPFHYDTQHGVFSHR
uniref:THO complex subunit 5 homolog n=1 Tax=Myxine glutinosa TaxID=7769 RepID=UPI0035900B58